MKLIINISEQEYNECKNLFNMVYQEGYLNYNLNTALVMYVANGIPLPKGHGDLIDRSKLLVELECGIRAGNYEEGYEKYPHINDMDDCFDTVKYADTIIEADKEK